MELQVRKIKGSRFTKEEILEVIINSDNQSLDSVLHTIELVSGVGVTHGGGGQPSEYLHYKAVERDVDGDGIIDSSNIKMHVEQKEQGTSIIRVSCKVVTVADKKSFEEARSAYSDAAIEAGVTYEHPNGPDGTFIEKPPTLETTILKTGELTLEWSSDTFV